MFEITSVKILASKLVCLANKIMSVSELESKMLEKSVFGRPFWKMTAIEARIIGMCLKLLLLKSFPLN